VEGFQFNLPVLSDGRFEIADVETEIDPNQRGRYLQVPLGGSLVIGEKGRGTLEGKEYLTVRFKKILIPLEAGTLKVPQATVACNAVAGYRSRRDPFGNMFDDFFRDDFFGRREQAVYKKVVTPSNEPTLTVLDVPTEGKPANFSGLVGKYSISASATPTEVRVGDPITLTVCVSGPDYLQNVELPPLDRQPGLNRDFKIPSEMAPAKLEGNAKVFTQTLRARNADVKEIPAIELPYFDAADGRYAVARTEPIPLRVSPTQVVTAEDAEGRAIPAPKSELETWAKGIAHNYEDLSVLANQVYGPAAWVHAPLWWAILGLPPVLYVTLLVITGAVRRRRADPAAREARQAYGAFVQAMRKLRNVPQANPQACYASVLEALRKYVGKRLRLPPGALTYRNVRPPLEEKGVKEENLRALEQVFETCEASRYAGAADGGALSAFLDDVLEVVKMLEKTLK